MSISKLFLIPFTYIAIMALGMTILHHGFGYTYGDGDWINVLVFIEIALVAFTVAALKKYSSWKESGYAKINLKGFLWVLPSLAAMLYLVVKSATLFPTPLSPDQIRFLLLTGVTTLLVGFSEETMFRGILLHWSLKKYNVIVSVLISAIGFSLLHSINFLGGEDFPSMFLQLKSTFLFGLFMALLAIRVKNIIPLIMIHFLWDFFILTSFTLKVPAEKLGGVIIIPIYYQYIATVVLALSTIYFYVKHRGKSA